MLPDIKLDNETFEEILERAVKMIPGINPEWTDFNYHDPGITFLELFAWMKEMQQFHMDQIGENHKRKYLKLLGGTPRGIIPARTVLGIKGRKQTVLKRGTPFYVGDICFETERKETVYPISLIGGVRKLSENGENRFVLDEDGQRNLRIPVFGMEPKGGESFELTLSEALRQEEEYHLYIRVYDGYPVKRNPIKEEDEFVPLAKLELQYWGETGWLPVKLLEDWTHELLFSGSIRFQLPGEMKKEGEIYRLRFLLLESGYDMAPELEAISFHMAEVTQIQTLGEKLDFYGSFRRTALCRADSWLAQKGEYQVFVLRQEGWVRFEGKTKRFEEQGETVFSLELEQEESGIRILLYASGLEVIRQLGNGNGFPFQEMEIPLENICDDSVELMVETKAGSGIYRQWRRVQDFDGSGKEDCDFTVSDGKIRFGDCFHGMAPAGEILLCGLLTSFGGEGNVKADTIHTSEAELSELEVWNPRSAWGGAGKESLVDYGVRIRREVSEVYRAVTGEDYEKLALKTPGLMFLGVKSIPAAELLNPDKNLDEASAALVVAPFSGGRQRQPSKAYLENIYRMLEPKKMIGTNLKIMPVEYIGISVWFEIRTSFSAEISRRDAKQILVRYFEEAGKRFGQRILFGDIYGLLDTLETVGSVKSLVLDARGRNVGRNRNGDILLPPNGTAYLKEWECIVTPEN